MTILTGHLDALSTAENHLWEITHTFNFSAIKAENGAIGGEEFVTKKLDAYFSDPKHTRETTPVSNVSFLKIPDKTSKIPVAP